MQNISGFLNRHLGEPVWVFGKGPSLDPFPFQTAGSVRICINESVLAVPAPRYFFAHDETPIRNVASKWPSGCCGILQHVRAEFAASCGIDSRQLFTYTKCYADNRVRDLEPQQIAREAVLYGNSGTVHSALHFCRLIGAVRVVFVGFDGMGGYAKCIGLPDGGAAHRRIRDDTISLMNALKIPFEFYDPSTQAGLGETGAQQEQAVRS